MLITIRYTICQCVLKFNAPSSGEHSNDDLWGKGAGNESLRQQASTTK